MQPTVLKYTTKPQFKGVHKLMTLPRARWLALGLAMVWLTPAHAIPPPDMVVSIWQALLQVIGVAAVFVAGVWLGIRQFFAQYVARWAVGWLLAGLGVGALVLAWVWFSPVQAATTIPQAEVLPIESIIKRERDDWVRQWKLQTVHEMEREANLTRQAKGLPAMQFQPIASFTPQALASLLKIQSKQLYLLDIREDLERSKFRINHQAIFRYGDLVQGIMPAQIPKDRLLVVLCHSGLRGYLGAHFLRQAGYAKVAFLQGGLAQWHKDGLPVEGLADYKVKAPTLLDKRAAKQWVTYKVQVDPAGTTPLSLGGMVQLPFETASTVELQPVLQASRHQPVLVACKTYGGCFHGLNLIFWLEKQGGQVAGIYDESGKHLQGLVE